MGIFGKSYNKEEAAGGKRWSGRFSTKKDMNKMATALERRQTATSATEAEAYQLEDIKTQTQGDIVLDDSQMAAKRLLLTHNRAALIGYAGTGKTTIMREVIKEIVQQIDQTDWEAFRAGGGETNGKLPEKKYAFACCAFTNRAAQNLASKLDEDFRDHCMSLHSCLAFQPVSYSAEGGVERMRFEPRYHEANKLPLQAIFVDEAGNLNDALWHQLLDACAAGVRVYLLGDIAQLPPVGGVSPLPFAMGEWPTAVLEKIHRQAEHSPIIYNATQIREGRPWNMQHDPAAFRMSEMEELPEQSMPAYTYAIKYISAMYAQGAFDPMQDVILVSRNTEGAFNREKMNARLRHMFNPIKTDEKGVELNPPINIGTALGMVSLSVGDRVMAMTSGGRNANEERLVTGSMAVVTSIAVNEKFKGDMAGLGVMDRSAIRGNEKPVQISFEPDAFEMAKKKMADLDADEREEAKKRQASHVVTVKVLDTGDVYELRRSAEITALSIAYAVTTHKYQGSQARNVVVILHEEDARMYNREWLYTAVTRAREAVVLLHTAGALDKATSRTTLPGRNVEEKAERLRRAYRQRLEKNPAANYPRLPGVHKLDEHGGRIAKLSEGEYPYDHL